MYDTKITFVISSDIESLASITDIIGLTPTEIRNKSDFPVPELAHSEWCISTGRYLWNTISEPFDMLKELLLPRLEHIDQAVRLVNGKAAFVVSVHSENDELPELVLPPQIIKFIGLFNAEVGFGIYANEGVAQ